MKKEFIMRNKIEIDEVFKNGRYLSNGMIMFKFLDSKSTKFLFAVSSKKFKRAVDRNKIKRFMKESLRESKITNKNVAVVYVGEGVPTFFGIKNSISKLSMSLR